MKINLNPVTKEEYQKTVTQMAELATKSAKTAEEKLQIKVTMGELLDSYSGDDRIIPSKDLKIALDSTKQEDAIQLPHPDISRAVDGCRPKQLIVVSGAPKSGKTIFLYDMTTRMENVKPLFLFFEERPLEILRKIRQFRPDYEIPEFYTPETYTEEGIEWIKIRMLEGKYKWGCKIVVIDNLHYITQGEGAKVPRYDKLLTAYTKDLKDFAMRWNITIFLVVHMNKTPEDRPPTVYDIADTAGIGQIADKVWFIQREGDTRIVNFYSDRDRQTGYKGKIELMFDRGTYHEGIKGSSDAEIKALADRLRKEGKNKF